ncbi:MAG: amidohydrolase [Chloroflexi bacterium]|nr:amidohydrolase [Chloroflexota bacterium]
MPKTELIDVHTHIFPTEEISNRFLAGLGYPAARTGTVEGVLATMRQVGISRTVMLLYMNIRTLLDRDVAALPADLSPAQRQARAEEVRCQRVGKLSANNTWGCQAAREHSELVAFVGIDAAAMTEAEIRAEIAKGVQDGARGVKIVPAAMAMYANDPRLWPAYEECERRGLPLLAQSGNAGMTAPYVEPWGRPSYWGGVLAQFPRLKVILAHMGIGFEEDVAQLTRRFPNLHTDISHRLHVVDREGLTSEAMVGWVRRIGVERVLFGTNFPMNDPAEYVRVFHALPLTDAEREAIASGNARRVLGV